jgi:hypothetical protein
MGLAGCDTQNGKQDTPAEEPIGGGWEIRTDVTESALSDEVQARFDAALESYEGDGLAPVCVLATQVVAGTNYAILCTGEPAGWYVAVLYADLQGGAEITSAQQIDVSSPALAENAQEEGLTGAYTVVDPVDIELPDDAAAAFATGGENYVGVDLHPIALLATQVVAGTNYRILCSGAVVAPDAPQQLYVVDVYEDLDGGAEYTSVGLFDLLAYV